MCILHGSRCKVETGYRHEERHLFAQRAKIEHTKYFWAEKLEYYNKNDKAKLHPERYFSIIVDGADQSSSGLLYLVARSKDNRGYSLKALAY